MSESPPPTIAGDAADGRAAALTPEQVAAVLADFRSWLAELPAEEAASPPERDTAPDLFTLLEQLTALRHEVNLQTKSSRAQQEQNAATLGQLSLAFDDLQQARTETARDGDDRLRPLLKTLVELYDALSVAGREAQRVQDKVLPSLVEPAADVAAQSPEPPHTRVPALLRWLVPGVRDLCDYPAKLAAWRERQDARADERNKELARTRQLLGSITAGYAMSLQRVERALKQHGLEPVAAAGQPFDPERMEAVEAVTDSGEAPGRVVDEVQRGYLWNGRVFRFAKVRVAK
jgi:molecular chaperone GrpE